MSVTESLTTFGRQLSVGGGGVRRGGNGRGRGRGGGLGGGNNPGQGGGVSWTPAQIATALWLDAADTATITSSANAVTQWNDKSGNNRHFAQATPGVRPSTNVDTRNGNNVLTFAGSFLTSVNPNTTWDFLSNGTLYSTFMVVEIGAEVGPGPVFGLMGTDATGVSGANGFTQLFWFNAPGSKGLGLRCATRTETVEPNIFRDSTFQLVSVEADWANATPANRVAIRVNGGAPAFPSPSGTGTLTGALYPMQIGSVGNDASADYRLHGKIAEIIIVSGLVSEPTRLLLEQYLLSKWGLPGHSSAFDSNAASYIAAVEAADGQALEAGVRTAINNFVVGCKSDGIWTAIKSSCILAGARTLAGALTPLTGTAPTNNGFVSGDYNRETGLLGNGSSKYLDSNRANNADGQNSAHVSVYASTWGTTTSTTKFPIGRQIGGFNERALAAGTAVNSGNLSARVQSTNAFASHGSARVAGFVGASRVASGTVTVRNNGSTTSVSQTSTTPSSPTLFVFAASNGTTPGDGGTASAWDDSRLAFYSIGSGLDLALLDSRVTTLMTDLAAAIA